MTISSKTPPKTATRRLGGDPAGMAQGAAHVVSVGIAPADKGGVIDALIEDIRPLKPARVVALGTAAARVNADALFKGLRLAAAKTDFVPITKPAHLDAVYREASAAIAKLEAEGFSPNRIGVHFTAGTKVMSAGMVLAAVSHGCERLRYLAWQGEGEPSRSIAAAPKAFRAEGDVRLAETLLRELRFRSARDVLAQVNADYLPAPQRKRVHALSALADAYAAWDNFRAADFLKFHRAAGKVPEPLADLTASSNTLSALKRIADAEKATGVYPVELIADLHNNAIRRLAERRTDDAMTRLYRCAELFAQRILAERHGIRTEDVDIRRVPPRYRVVFEALRRLDDVKIKLGLRKSFELLAYRDDPVGAAFLENRRLQDILEERRRLVLAHGVVPAPASLALELLGELNKLLRVEIPGWEDTANSLQFPWIDNKRVLADVGKAGDENTAVSCASKPK